MSKLTLTDFEVQNLINTYKSELRKLQYQVQKTKATINELQNSSLGTLEIEKVDDNSSSENTESRGPGRPKGSTNKKRGPGRPKGSKNKSSRGPGRPKGSKNKKKGKKRKKRVVIGGYKLSDWDNMVINALKSEGQALSSKEMVPYGTALADEKNYKMDEAEVRQKISRSIHKLANKREKIVKTKKKGRGNAYALPNWLNNQGNLKDKYQR